MLCSLVSQLKAGRLLAHICVAGLVIRLPELLFKLLAQYFPVHLTGTAVQDYLLPVLATELESLRLTIALDYPDAAPIALRLIPGQPQQAQL